jgi:hypothetical protein
MDDSEIIRYEVVESSLKRDREYRGKILRSDKVNSDNLITEIVRSNTTVTREDALAVISLYEKLIVRHLRRGHTVTTGLFRAALSLKGGFENHNSNFDNRIHSAHIVIQPAKGLNKKVNRGLRFHKTRRSVTDQILTGIHDYSSGRKGKDGNDRFVLTRGGAFDVRGGSLKVYGYTPEYELKLIGSGKDSHIANIVNVLPRKVTAVVPGDVPPGDYRLEYRAVYGSVVRDYGELPVTVAEG